MKTNPSPKSSAKPIFTAALRLADLQERERYLEEACGANGNLQQDVKALLAAHNQQATGILEKAVERFQSATPADLNLAAEEPIDIASHPMIGPYKLLEQIGEGGMGVVYMAQQQSPVRRKVALKIIKAGMDTKQVIARFAAERQALAMMDHPYIAKILDAGSTPNGRPYFVMDLAPGLRVTDYCDKVKLTTRQRLQLFVKICQALQHSHVKGIIHRDLKPSNVLVAEIDGEAVPKVIDFGVAKAINQELTEQTLFTLLSQVIGTPLYMSPEQTGISGVDVDVRSDVYSLGVLLYVLLTGTTPFSRESIRELGLDEIHRIIRETEPPRPSQRVSTLRAEAVSTLTGGKTTDARRLQIALRGELDWIVLKAMEKDRNRRYQSAGELAADVERFLTDRPVVACPPSVLYRVRKFARRNQVVFIACAGVLTALLIGGAFSLWQSSKASFAHQLAQQQIEASVRSQQHADHQQEIADAERRRARLTQYLADMKRASDSMRQGETPGVVRLLDRHRPADDEEDLRGFEWHYMQKSVSKQPSWELDLETSVWFVATSPDRQMIALAMQNGQVQVRSAESGELIKTFFGSKEINSIAWHPSGNRIAAATQNGQVHLWAFSSQIADSLTSHETEDEQTAPLLSFATHDGEAFSVCFTPDGNTIVSCGSDGAIRTWNAATGEPLSVLQEKQSDVEQLAMSNSGNLLASADGGPRGEYGVVTVWDIARGTRKLTLRSPSAWHVLCVAFSSDESYVAAGDEDGNLMVADTDTGAFTSIQQPDGIGSVTFNEETHQVVTGDRNGTIQVWTVSQDPAGDLHLTSDASNQWLAHPGSVQSLATLSDGETVVSSSRDGGVARWTIDRESTRWTCAKLTDFAIASDGSLFGCLYEVLQFDLAKRRLVAASQPHSPPWYDIAAATAAPRIAVHDSIDTVAVIDWQLRTEVTRWTVEHEMDKIAISPSGGQVAVVWSDGQDCVNLFDVENGAKPRAIEASICNCLAYSPDGQTLAFGSEDDLVLLDLDRRGSTRRLVGHDRGVQGVAFGPDGQWIATVAADGNLKLWDRTTAKEVSSVKAHRVSAGSVDFSEDGRVLVTGGTDGMVRLWHLETMQPLLEIETKGFPRKVRFADQDRRLVVWLKGGQTIVHDVVPHSLGTTPMRRLVSGAQIHGLGHLPGKQTYFPTDVSDDGRVVVGDYLIRPRKSYRPRRSFRWTKKTGITALPLPKGYRDSYATAIGNEGQVLGRFKGAHAISCLGRWTNDGSPVIEPHPNNWKHVDAYDTDGPFVGGAYRLADGSQKKHAFLFDGDQYRELPSVGDPFSTTLNSVRCDGSLLTGFAWKGDVWSSIDKSKMLRVVRWHHDRAEFLPGFGDEPYMWFPDDVSADGSIVVGYRWPEGTERDRYRLAFLWKDGRVELLGDLPGGAVQSRATGISEDGRVVVGHSETATGSTAFVWDRAHGMRRLEDVLRQHGAHLAGWQLTVADDTSADGTCIAGHGVNPQGKQEAYIARLPKIAFGEP